MSDGTIRDELVALQKRSRKRILDAKVVLAWAKKHPQSALHAAIEWDDSKAAQEHRLFQVRRLIQIHVVTGDGRPVMVSLSVDRPRGGGYRAIDDVVKDRDLTAIMLEDALNELTRVKARYQWLKELSAVWAEIDRAAELRQQRKKAA